MSFGNSNQQTKMAAALTEAVMKTAQAGRVGKRILTNNAKVGLNGKPAQRKAATAVGK